MAGPRVSRCLTPSAITVMLFWSCTPMRDLDAAASANGESVDAGGTQATDMGSPAVGAGADPRSSGAGPATGGTGLPASWKQ